MSLNCKWLLSVTLKERVHRNIPPETMISIAEQSAYLQYLALTELI
ncbi:hypothetical protein VIBNISO65_1310043 [Vibrio nigripulchritudo SO65]|nr:hypothetical protein VIBNISO65_1310043 [Vibrio nigripulchritudo SO65]